MPFKVSNVGGTAPSLLVISEEDISSLTSKRPTKFCSTAGKQYRTKNMDTISGS